MSTKDQAWAERVGREAVALGMPCGGGLLMLDWIGSTGLAPDRTPAAGFHGWPSAVLPDFRDRLTELACIAWVEDVAREVYGDKFHMKFGFLPKNHCWWVAVDNRGQDIYEGCDTLAEACIAAVRAMKGANQ